MMTGIGPACMICFAIFQVHGHYRMAFFCSIMFAGYMAIELFRGKE